MKSNGICHWGKIASVFAVLGLALVLSACPNLAQNETEVSEGRISGRVSFANPESLGTITVFLERTDGLRVESATPRNFDRGRTVGSGIRSTIADADGFYVFDNIPGGVYTIHAVSEDEGERAILVNISVEEDSQTNVADMTLRPTGNITGRVILEGSENNNLGFTVFAAGTSFSAFTDQAGWFTISGVPAETIFQIAVMRGNFATIWTNATVQSDGTYELGNFDVTYAQLQGDAIIWRGALSAPPENPQRNWSYFNTTTRRTYVFDGTQWIVVGQVLTTSNVIYRGNGHTGGIPPVDPNPDGGYVFGATVVVMGQGTLVKDDHRFIGWSRSADGSGRIYQPGDTFIMAGDAVVFYAVWREMSAHLFDLASHLESLNRGETDPDVIFAGTPLVQAGNPAFEVVEHNGRNALRVAVTAVWEGFDINRNALNADDFIRVVGVAVTENQMLLNIDHAGWNPLGSWTQVLGVGEPFVFEHVLSERDVLDIETASPQAIRIRGNMGGAVFIVTDLSMGDKPEGWVPPEPAPIGILSLTIGAPVLGRAILPGITLDDFVRFELEFFARDADNTIFSLSWTERSGSIELDAGTWDLYITAFLDGNSGEIKGAIGNLYGIVVPAGETVTGYVTISPILTSGQGTFSWDINFEVNIATARMEIISLDENGSQHLSQIVYLVVDGEPIPHENPSRRDLYVGQYQVILTLDDARGNRAISTQILHIYANLVSHFEVSPPTNLGFTISFADFQSGKLNIMGPTVSLIADGWKTISVDTPWQYDVDSIRWFMGDGVVASENVVGDYGETLVLNSGFHGNRVGTHSVTVEVSKDGVMYSSVILITVVL